MEHAPQLINVLTRDMRERIAHSLWFKQNTGFLNILDIFKRNRRDERADPPSNLNESILLQQRKRLMHRRAARMELLRNHLFAEDIPRVDRVGDDRLPQLIVRDLRQRGSRNRNDILPFDLRH